MALVRNCCVYECEFNDDGECGYEWGIEIDEDVSCISFEYKEEEGEQIDADSD